MTIFEPRLKFKPWIKFFKFGFRFLNLKYLRSTTFGCKDIEIRKSEFVAQFLDGIFSVILFKVTIVSRPIIHD